jgi:predicted RNase H-like nuclease
MSLIAQSIHSIHVDVLARALLGLCVFLGARRGMWEFGSQRETTAHYHARSEAGVSCQLWGIQPRIREVDQLVTQDRQRTLCESHPELVFWHLNGGVRSPNKKTQAGKSQRVAILKEQGFTEIDRWLGQRQGTGVARDELIDACACAWAAKTAKNRIPRAGHQLDRRWLKMEFWY